jgi:hypothetical protein
LGISHYRWIPELMAMKNVASLLAFDPFFGPATPGVITGQG